MLVAAIELFKVISNESRSHGVTKWSQSSFCAGICRGEKMDWIASEFYSAQICSVHR